MVTGGSLYSSSATGAGVKKEFVILSEAKDLCLCEESECPDSSLRL
jgi:hypothetical protein